MSRVKRGTIANKRRRSTLEMAKGYRFGRSKKERQAREAIYHAQNHAFAHRRRKKGDFRRLWNIRLNAAVRPYGFSYSRFIDALTKKDIKLNRKMLSEIAVANPQAFERIVSQLGGASAPKVVKNEDAPAKKDIKTDVEAGAPDDLTKIEGIGPKIAATLVAAGIDTFAKLADAKDEDTQEIIKDVRGNHDATTWNEQAALARDGKWEELQKWQDELDGGKEK